MLGILLGPGVLLLARLFRHMSYVFLSKCLCSGVCVFFFSRTSPLYHVMGIVVLSYPAYAVRYVFWLMVASGNCGYVAA